MATLRCLFLVARALLTSQSHLNRKFSQAWAESVLTFRISDRASLSTSWVRSLLKTSIQSQSRHRSVNVDRFWWLWLMSIELKLIEIRSGWCLGRRLEDRRSSHRTCQAIDPKSSEYTVSNHSPLILALSAKVASFISSPLFHMNLRLLIGGDTLHIWAPVHIRYLLSSEVLTSSNRMRW